ncbi:two-component system response regulator (Ntr family protein) [Desulforapulum autotrophicum HRM2]|uniref:Two-component system response regulator (Ntr family protein) n=1 Tax=Desulforapulum autotrophicum (strain ATCC 43914 / DSM 3382 / VKM B-1955 / HRM2) TaxID=177437 RepID=C0QC79_DESAH|nr:response regulator [Desulforapulum autotrophicum]ACN17096.1 two-component system response regulator (Ntr family protein) [Desulforapulum autotrophicum HRM2]
MGRITVLLVDDEREFVDTLAERITMRSFDTLVAYSGEQALSMIESTPPRVMVLDLKMPGMGGVDVLERVKAEHTDISVIILTGHGDERDQTLVMDMGASGYFQKPVDLDVLVAKIMSLK